MCKYRTYRAARPGTSAAMKRFKGGKVIRDGAQMRPVFFCCRSKQDLLVSKRENPCGI